MDKTVTISMYPCLIRSGEFKKSSNDYAVVEVIKRTPVRTINGGGVVNKVLKRRKKFRRLPLRQNDNNTDNKNHNSDHNHSDPQSRTLDESFEKLEPLKTKYKTSDSIRMHLRHKDKADNNLISRNSASSRSRLKNNNNHQNGNKKPSNTNHKNRQEASKHHIQLSDKFKFKQELNKRQKPSNQVTNKNYFEQIGAESREEKTYNYFIPTEKDIDDDDNGGEILQAAGYHTSLSIQEPYHNGLEEPPYDYTIGKIIFMTHLWQSIKLNKLLVTYRDGNRIS